ncbi:hypothetical protein, partial [Salmonella enterica]|uniref:hypothetical protein n=1 Tax=Salmonella enterica TaxID=28901 RepID=UPI0011611604
RIHSPKGRATLVREWLRLLADRGVDPLKLEKELPEKRASLRTRHQAIQPVAQRLDLSVNKRFIVTREFHDIQAKHFFIRHIG